MYSDFYVKNTVRTHFLTLRLLTDKEIGFKKSGFYQTSINAIALTSLNCSSFSSSSMKNLRY